MVAKFKRDECKGCSLCVSACPKKIIEISKTALNAKGYHPAELIDEASCIACGACAKMCPDVVIEIY